MGDRDRKNRWSRDDSEESRSIGPLRKVKNPRRRKAAEQSVKAWALTYLPNWFPLAVSPAHEDAAALLQSCTDEGGLGCLAISRGFGKTTWTLAAVLRAVLSGRRKYVVMICATDKLAEKAVKKLKAELESNDRIDEDYPEATQAVRALKRITRRAAGQVWEDGTPTLIEWTAGGLTLPTAKRGGLVAPSSGAIVHAVGITGAVRGLSATGPNGEIIRPDMVVLDDCQTRESAKSPTQTTDRESAVCDDVLGLAGPTTAIAAVQLLTPNYANDLAERFLDPQRHPEWQGRRTKMLAAMPAAMTLWEEYRDLRQEGQRQGDRGEAATEFYRQRRESMDAGAVVTWPERMKPGEVSGLQSAMNIWCDNPRGFRSEYQCEPESGSQGGTAKELAPADVSRRLSGLDRLAVPRECSLVTAGFDAGRGSLHWYAVVAWTDAFGGSIIDYGWWPRQPLRFFEAQKAPRKLRAEYPGLTDAQLVYQGLADLTGDVMGRAYRNEAGGELQITRAAVDSGYESDAVYQFVRASPHVSVLTPSKGIPRSRTARGVSEWAPRPGERKGHFWRLTKAESGRGQMVQFDPDAWKTVVYERMTVPVGGRTALTVYGRTPGEHEMLAEHLAAEYAEPMPVRGTVFDKWYARPDRNDNHLFDCVVLAAVAAGLAGLVPSANPDGTVTPKKPTAPPVPAAEAQARRRGPVNAGKGRRLEFA
jgi:hypothetical protein